MANVRWPPILFYAVALFLCTTNGFDVSKIKIQALSPSGIKVSVPDAPGMGLFVFQGNVNRAIYASNNDVGAISREVLSPTQGEWVFQDPNVSLKVGDVINYYVFVSENSVGRIRDNLSYTITELENGECRRTLSRVRGGKTICSGQTIFEDNFNNLNEDLWQIEQYIPSNHPDFPFVSYQRPPLVPTVSVADGQLRISPQLQQSLPGFTNESIYSGSLNLFTGCTGEAGECYLEASGASILPPIASGRLKSRLSFTFGTVYVRARLPRGDWLYPEILLEPFLKKYGNLNSASGVMKIAAARGNGELNGGITDYSNKMLYGGPIMDFECRNYLIQNKKLINGLWSDDFHVYSVTWTPDHIILEVDSEEWLRVEPRAEGLLAYFPESCREIPRRLLTMGSKMAPFDDYFQIVLGVAAGGISEFPDDVNSAGRHRKPWRNQGRKASLNFWHDIDSWFPTWTSPELIVDYVKVVAL